MDLIYLTSFGHFLIDVLKSETLWATILGACLSGYFLLKVSNNTEKKRIKTDIVLKRIEQKNQLLLELRKKIAEYVSIREIESLDKYTYSSEHTAKDLYLYYEITSIFYLLHENELLTIFQKEIAQEYNSDQKARKIARHNALNILYTQIDTLILKLQKKEDELLN